MRNAGTAEVIVTRTGEFSLLEQHIVYGRMKDGIEIEINDVKENRNAAAKMAKGCKYCLLIDARIFTPITKEARALAAKEHDENLIARAILVNTLAGKLLSNFFIKLDKSQIPSKVFNSEQKAMEWLREKRRTHL